MRTPDSRPQADDHYRAFFALRGGVPRHQGTLDGDAVAEAYGPRFAGASLVEVSSGELYDDSSYYRVTYPLIVAPGVDLLEAFTRAATRWLDAHHAAVDPDDTSLTVEFLLDEAEGGELLLWEEGIVCYSPPPAGYSNLDTTAALVDVEEYLDERGLGAPEGSGDA